MIKITIIGAGNEGLAISILLKNNGYNPTIVTSKRFLSNIYQGYDTDNNSKSSFSFLISNSYCKETIDADLLIITHPTFLVEKTIKLIENFNPKTILFTPGYGNKDKYCEQLIKNGTIIAGLDRVPCISRLNGNDCFYSVKSSVRVGCVQVEKTNEIKDMLEELFKIKVIALPNYLTVNFTPSNPILHTSRLYSLFKHATFKTEFPRMIKFYKEWDDVSSAVMIDMDNELQQIINAYDDVDLSMVIPITKHYESHTIEQMTKKLSGIPSLSDIDSPMIKNKNDMYVIDKNSRYFKEDFDFGLRILKNYALLKKISTPIMDKVLSWYDNLMNLKNDSV